MQRIVRFLATACLLSALAACAPVAAGPPKDGPASPSPATDAIDLVMKWQPAPGGFGTPVAPDGLDAKEIAAWRHGVDTVGLLLAPAQTHPSTLRGDPGPVTSLASGWIVEDLTRDLAPGQGLRTLVWTTRFPADIRVTDRPRVHGRWQAEAPFDGTVSWEGSFAYPLEREGETSWVVIHRRITAEECDAAGCGAVASRAVARGVDMCASHRAQAFVPTFRPLTREDVAEGLGTSPAIDLEQVIADCAAEGA